MSCIVGLVAENGEIWIGADSASASDDWEVRPVAQPKVFKRGHFIIGYTTSFRMGQILEHQLEVRKQKLKESDHQYMVTAFIDAVRDCLKAAGWAKIQDNREKGGQFLVGYNGKLYEIHNDFQVSETLDGMDAIGCGGPYALGTLYCIRKSNPEHRIKQALEAAAYFSGAVRPPFRIEKI